CVDGGLWARIESWQDRRFESDPVVWPVLIYPESNVLTHQHELSARGDAADPAARGDAADPAAGGAAADPAAGGAAANPASGGAAADLASGGARTDAGSIGVCVEVARERWTDSASRGLMMRRYLGEDERVEYERHNPRAQRTWLLGRIAAKDAVRRWLWGRGARAMHPVEVRITNDVQGRPMASLPRDVCLANPAASALSVSISHTEWVGVAVVSDTNPIGVDVEPVTPRAPRSDAFVDIALTPGEQGLRPDGVGSDEWVALTWTAKEAVAKALGTGLQGRPRSFEVEEVTDPLSPARRTLWVRDPDGRRWTVASTQEGELVIAATIGQPNTASPVQKLHPSGDGSPSYPTDRKDDHAYSCTDY
ncbi:MAG TPA: 4'-phosphopantetheinyl transferase superfamily protein, partial [Acidimicrobiales bacterium]|nr:4'-phosphopantetheinyl transferase superfamily protein [Acidimicrobiales bacterium]